MVVALLGDPSPSPSPTTAVVGDVGFESGLLLLLLYDGVPPL